MPDPRIPHFYIFPKIHKPAISGHQVVSSINCHTVSISKHSLPYAKFEHP